MTSIVAERSANRMLSPIGHHDVLLVATDLKTGFYGGDDLVPFRSLPPLV
jgi:hypothetical protein